MNSIYLKCYQNILRVLVLENNGIPNPKDKDKKKYHIIICYIIYLLSMVW